MNFRFLIFFWFLFEVFFISRSFANSINNQGFIEQSYCNTDYSFLYNAHPYYIQAITDAINSGDWMHSVFFDVRAYDWLYLAYKNNLINESSFLEAQDYLQIVSAFGWMPGIKSDLLVAPAVRINRVNVLDQNIQLNNFKESLRRHIGDKKFKQFIQKNSESDGLQMTVVIIEPDFLSSLNTSHGHPSDGATDQIQFSRWITFLQNKSPALAFVDGENAALMLPGHKLFDTLRNYLPNYIASEHRVKMQGHYCLMTMDDVVRLRGAARHPLAMYHPKHEINFVKPHNAFFSTMSSRHDFYHIIQLDSIPFEHQQWLLIEEIIAEDLARLAEHALKNNMSLIDAFPEAVRLKIALTEDDYFFGDPQAHYARNGNKAANLAIAVFNDNLRWRLLADQDLLLESNPKRRIYKAIIRHGWGMNSKNYNGDFFTYLFFRTHFSAYYWNRLYGRNNRLSYLFNTVELKYEDYPFGHHSKEIRAILKAWE